MRIYSRVSEGCLGIDVLEGDVFLVHGDDGIERIEGKRELLSRLGVVGYSYERYFRLERSVVVPERLELRVKKVRSRVGIRAGRGIDLDVKWLDVKRLFLAGYGKLLHMKGLDVEDVLQEVYMGLLIRNSGDGAWDPAKSSFGHYVHMVCGSVVLNYVSKQKRVHRTDMSLRREIMQIARSGLSLCY